MDGNRRWAKNKGLPVLEGHRAGGKTLKDVVRWTKDAGVKHLILYTFSTENWNRPKEEVDGLMDLLVRSLANEVKELSDSGVRLLAIGDIAGLPQACQNELQESIDLTKDNSEITVVLALKSFLVKNLL